MKPLTYLLLRTFFRETPPPSSMFFLALSDPLIGTSLVSTFSGFKAWHDYVGGGSSIKIDGDYLYYITDDNYFNIVHKNNGNTLNNIFPDTTRRGIKSTGFRAKRFATEERRKEENCPGIPV